MDTKPFWIECDRRQQRGDMRVGGIFQVVQASLSTKIAAAQFDTHHQIVTPIDGDREWVTTGGLNLVGACVDGARQARVGDSSFRSDPMFAPLRTAPMAMALPIPRPAPVMKIVFPRSVVMNIVPIYGPLLWVAVQCRRSRQSSRAIFLKVYRPAN